MAVNILGSNVEVVTSNRPLSNIVDFTFSTGLLNTNGVIITKDSEIDHDSLSNYNADEHINWTSTSENFYTSGSIEAASLKLSTTPVITEIETTLTDSDTKISTSGAVKDYVDTALSSTGTYVSTTSVSFDDTSAITLITLPIGSTILDVKVYVTEASSQDPGSDILKIGTTVDDDKYSTATEIQTSIGWQVPTWVIDPTIPTSLSVETTLTAEITLNSTSEPQVIISVWYTTS